jgi:hypothetical protein
MSAEVPDDGPSPLEWLCDQAAKAGLRARAWTVLTHNSRLGERHPECCVENLFGDVYPYALCPNNPHVQQYTRTLLADVGAHAGLAAIELEAFWAMGWKHSSHHEKASFAPDALGEWLLSLCWCAHCCAGLDDAAHVRSLLAPRLRELFAQADAMAPSSYAAKTSGATRFSELLALAGAPPYGWLVERDLREFWRLWGDPRLAIERGLREARRRVPAPVRLALQVHPSEFFRGSQVPASGRYGLELGQGHEYVVTCYGDGPDGIGKALAALPRPAGGLGTVRLCIHPKAPQFAGDGDLRVVRDLCAQHAIASLAVYHLGLLPWRTIERVAAAFRA